MALVFYMYIYIFFYFIGNTGGLPLEERDLFILDIIPLFFLMAVPNTSKPAVALKSCGIVILLNKKGKRRKIQIFFLAVVWCDNPFCSHSLFVRLNLLATIKGTLE